MVATLVVLLPSSYRGGTLLVENQGESKRMLNHQWQVLQAGNKAKLKHFKAAQLNDRAEEHFKAAEELIRAVLNCHNQLIHDDLMRLMLDQNSLYPSTDLAILLLSFKQDYQNEEFAHWWYQEALQQLYDLLSMQKQNGMRESTDWSIMDKNNCSCSDCQDLNVFLQSNSAQKKSWPLNKNRRMHIHRTIDGMRLPVSHQTQRSGSPHKLILQKTSDLFLQDKKRFKRITEAVKLLSDSGLSKQ